MKPRLTSLALAASALLLLPVAGAAAGPKGAGVIRGRVVEGATGEPVRGIDVDLISALPGGKGRFTETIATDRDGRFVFRRLPTGSGRAYALSVVHDGGLFAGQPIDELARSANRFVVGTPSANRTVIDTQLRVWPTISNPNAVLVQRHNMFVGQGEDGLGVIESLTIVNTTDAAYIGRARSFGREVAQSTFTMSLPDNANDGRMLPQSDFFGTPVAVTEMGIGLRVAIPPGEWNVMFAYTLEGSAGTYDLSHTALYPTLNTAVHVADGLSVDSNRLSEAGGVTLGDRRYVRWASDGVVEAGGPIQIAVTADAGTSPWLVGGLVGAGLLAAALFVWTLLRNRKAPLRRPVPSEGTESREQLVAAVAELDLRHDAGDIDDSEWTARRAVLKSDLARRSATTGTRSGSPSVEDVEEPTRTP